MQGQQESELDTENIIAKMAAAAVYPAHLAGGDSASGMGSHGSHSFQGGQSQGVLFGGWLIHSPTQLKAVFTR